MKKYKIVFPDGSECVKFGDNLTINEQDGTRCIIAKKEIVALIPSNCYVYLLA